MFMQVSCPFFWRSFLPEFSFLSFCSAWPRYCC